MTVTLLATPPAATVVKRLARRRDRHCYDATCRNCGSIATFDPAGLDGRFPNLALREALARKLAHNAAAAHTCPEGGTQ